MAISRRSFLQGSAVSALGLAAGVAPKFTFAADSKDAIKVASILDCQAGWIFMASRCPTPST
ncbi:twin-arginine translocation signal domain-containing protein (plasmid) [Pseudomonas silvicola]|nr:twin-arginine translocation signal domain-containing protein [Pseudomonas silvicola]